MRYCPDCEVKMTHVPERKEIHPISGVEILFFQCPQCGLITKKKDTLGFERCMIKQLKKLKQRLRTIEQELGLPSPAQTKKK